MERETYIAALHAYCETCGPDCKDCPVSRDRKAAEICSRASFSDMSDDELTYLLSVVNRDQAVNSPSHYNRGDIECIDAIEASMGKIAYMGFLKGQIIKYVWRYQYKGKPVEDLRKARYYLEKLIAATEAQGGVE